MDWPMSIQTMGQEMISAQHQEIHDDRTKM